MTKELVFLITFIKKHNKSNYHNSLTITTNFASIYLRFKFILANRRKEI